MTVGAAQHNGIVRRDGIYELLRRPLAGAEHLMLPVPAVNQLTLLHPACLLLYLRGDDRWIRCIPQLNEVRVKRTEVCVCIIKTRNNCPAGSINNLRDCRVNIQAYLLRGTNRQYFVSLYSHRFRIQACRISREYLSPGDHKISLLSLPATGSNNRNKRHNNQYSLFHDNDFQ